MIEEVEGFYHKVKPSHFSHREILERAQVQVDEARSVQSVPGYSRRTGNERKRQVVFLVCSGKRIDGTPAAERQYRRDLDVTEKLADKNVSLAARDYLLFLAEGKIKQGVDDESVTHVLT